MKGELSDDVDFLQHAREKGGQKQLPIGPQSAAFCWSLPPF